MNAQPYSRKVVRSFLWQGGAQFVGQAISWISTIVVIRLLSPGDYGLMAMAGVFMGLFFLVADLGFGAAAVQAREIDREQLRRVFGIVLVVHTLGALLTFAGAPFVARFFDEPRLVAVLRVLSIDFVVIALYTLPQAQLLRELDFKRKARVDVAGMTFGTAVALVMAFTGFGVWALVGSLLAQHAAKAIAYNVVRPMRLTPLFSLRAVTTLVQFSLYVTLGRILFFLYGQTDLVIGGRVLGKETLGLYAVALSVAAIPMEKVLPVVTQVSFAAFSRIQADAERVRRNLLRGVQLVSLVCFPAFLGMAVVAGDLVPVVLGPRWIGLVVPFQLLCLVLPLKAVAALFAPALLGVGNAKLNVMNTLVAVVTMTAAMLVGVRYGVLGMCLAWVIAYPLVFWANAMRTLRALGVPYGAFVERLVFPAAAGIAMAALVVGLREGLSLAGPPLLQLALMVVVGVAAYALLVLTFQRSVIRDLYTLVRS